MSENLLYQHFKNILKELSKPENYLIALSGGLDSCVLLHLMKCFSQEKSAQIRVIHIHHGISPNADIWAKFCEQLCEQYQFPFILEKVQLNFSAEEGLEADARTKRYQAIKKNIRENEALLTAHTQDDQAETFLLQLFRGAGAKGLSAMPMKKQLGPVEHLRPLLNFSRENLEEYAKTQKLIWVEDESNRDDRFDRNFLRNHIFPLLKSRWSCVNEHLSRVAGSFAESAQLHENLADFDLANALTENQNQIEIAPLLSLSVARQRNVLRRFFQRNEALMPDRKRLNQIIETIFLSRSDKNPCIRWKNIELHRFEGRVYLISRLSDFDKKQQFSWDFSEPLQLPGNLGTLKAEKKIGAGLRSDLDPTKIKVGFRQGGEVIRLHNQTQSLKKLFQSWQVPPWERDRIPFILYEGKLISVVGFVISDPYRCPPDAEGYLLNSF